MTDIKPKDGEWWMCEIIDRGDKSVAPLKFKCRWWYSFDDYTDKATGCSVLPLYRLSRHTKLNEREEAQAKGKQLVIFSNGAWVDVDIECLDIRIKPEEKPLIIPWDALDSKWSHAKFNKYAERIVLSGDLGGGAVIEERIGATLLNIDLTDVPDGATAERPTEAPPLTVTLKGTMNHLDAEHESIPWGQPPKNSSYPEGLQYSFDAVALGTHTAKVKTDSDGLIESIELTPKVEPSE